MNVNNQCLLDIQIQQQKEEICYLKKELKRIENEKWKYNNYERNNNVNINYKEELFKILKDENNELKLKLKEYEGIIYEMECLIEKANEKIDEVLNVNERLVKENKRLKQKKKKGKKKNKEENENIQNDNSNNNNTKEVNDNKCNEKEVDNEINNNEMKDEMVNVVEHNKRQYQRHPNYDLYNLNNNPDVVFCKTCCNYSLKNHNNNSNNNYLCSNNIDTI